MNARLKSRALIYPNPPRRGAGRCGRAVSRYQQRTYSESEKIMYYLKYSSRDADIYSIERGYLDDDINYDIGLVCRIRRI